MNRRSSLFATAAILGLIAAYGPALSADAVSPAIAAAIADSNRPQADKDRDAARHPAEMMAFSGVKAGDKIVEFVPGGGYVTRLFSKIVGGTGKVYAIILPGFPDRLKGLTKPVLDNPAYSNVTALEQNPDELKIPEQVDMVWISENYHDFKNMGPFHVNDTNAMDKAVMAALKPGGLYVISDYAAAAGKGLADTQSLHRIDIDVVKKEVTAAGFQLVEESKALANPGDDHTAKSAQGSDEFFLKFRKPR